MMRGFFLVMLMAALVFLAVLLIGLALSTRPDFAQVDYDSAFVYPDGDGFMLAIESGAYRIAPGPEPVGGCYKLYPPDGGSAYGRAEWAWFMCGN